MMNGSPPVGRAYVVFCWDKSLRSFFISDFRFFLPFHIDLLV